MRIVFAIPETLACAALTIAGVYMLDASIADKSANASILVVGGAAFLAFGIVSLHAAVRSILWHRAMLRRAMSQHGGPAGHTASGQD